MTIAATSHRERSEGYQRWVPSLRSGQVPTAQNDNSVADFTQLFASSSDSPIRTKIIDSLYELLGLHPHEPTQHHVVIGVTNDPYQRIQQHRSGKGSRFTSKYRLTRCIYLEESLTAMEAIAREKQLKGWTRRRKEALIDAVNPQWKELLGE